MIIKTKTFFKKEQKKEKQKKKENRIKERSNEQQKRKEKIRTAGKKRLKKEFLKRQKRKKNREIKQEIPTKCGLMVSECKQEWRWTGRTERAAYLQWTSWRAVHGSAARSAAPSHLPSPCNTKKDDFAKSTFLLKPLSGSLPRRGA